MLAVPVMSRAQSGMGSITGQVSDKNGALIPGATVTVTNTSTAVSNDTRTNASGIYLFQQLNPGQYKIEAEAPNFKRTVRAGVTLDVDDKLGIDLRLEVGGTSETVNVTAATPLLRNEDVTSGEVMTNSVIENFANLAGQGEVRNVLGAMQFAGDIQGETGSGGKAGLALGINGAFTTESNLRVNGGRTSATEYLVDGIPITQNLGRQISNTVPTVEDTSEFKVVTNGLGAQYGHLSGGAVDLSTQAGTKSLHGSFFEFMQQAALNANTWDNDDTIVKGKTFPKPGFHQNDFGVSMGGPVWLPHLYDGRGKTFWFANYEGSRYNIGGNAVLSSVLNDGVHGPFPGTNERGGDVSDMGTAIGDPNTPKPQIYDPYGPSSYPNMVNGNYQRMNLIGGDGMHIPQIDLDPMIQQYLKYVPLPNHAPSPGSATGNNYISSPKTVKGTNVYSIRVDQNFSDKSRMFARFTHNDGHNDTDPSFGPYSPSTKTLTRNGFGATLGYDYTFSPTMLLNVRVGGNYSPFSNGSFLPSNFSNSAFGYSSNYQGILGTNSIVGIYGPTTEANNVNASGWSNTGTLGLFGNNTESLASTNFVYAASLTKILGRHTMVFGYEGRRYYDNHETSSGDNAGGGFRFTAQSSNQYSTNSWNAQGNANGVGDFLMGLYSWNQEYSATAHSLRQNYFAAYAQDDFKVSPKLTASLGLRWETESPVNDPKHLLTIWDSNAPSSFTVSPGWTWPGAIAQAQITYTDPKTTKPVTIPIPQELLSMVQTPDWVTSGFPKGALRFTGTPEHPSQNANDWHPWNFSPRLGAAWQFRRDIVLRGSFGAFYLPTGGSLNGYNSTTGVAYSNLVGNFNHTEVQTEGINLSRDRTNPLCGCIESPSFPGDDLSKTSNNLALNMESGASGQAGAVDTKSHMPLEYDWSLGLQYEVKHGFLFEAVYNGNSSHNLLAKDMPGHFPANLYTGGPRGQYLPGNVANGNTAGANATIYTASVPSPFMGQGIGNRDGDTQSIGYLEYAYPYYGELQITNRNIGRSNFNGVNLRVEHRLSDGFQILANYTIAKGLDNVGGAETNQNGPSQGYGQGGKVPQDVQTIRNVYGLSGLDESGRFTVFGLYQIPLGRGRHWMNQRSGLGSNILEYAAGGWNISGDFVTTPGTPITFTNGAQSGTNSNELNFHNIYGSYAPGATDYSLKNPHWAGPKKSRYDPNKGQSPSVATPAFDHSQFVDSQEFTIGTLPPVWAVIRSPGNWNSDLSLSKNIPVFSADGTRYFQFRIDDTNFLNHPGIGGYDTGVDDNNFGLISVYNNHPNGERHIQLGARLIF
jgi:hypothetical protein